MSLKQKTLNISGTKYLIQEIPADYYLNLFDNSKDENGNLKTGEYMKKLIEPCLISPKMQINDFTGKISTLRAIVREIEKLVLGDEVSVEEEKNVQKPENKG